MADSSPQTTEGSERTLTVITTNVETVRIVACAVAQAQPDEMIVVLDKPWYDLSEDMQDKLFEAAKRIGAQVPELQPGWTPSFVYEVAMESPDE